MKLIEYFLTFQSLFFKIQSSLLVFEIQVCKIKTLSLSPLIVSRDSFSPGTWARFQTGGA